MKHFTRLSIYNKKTKIDPKLIFSTKGILVTVLLSLLLAGCGSTTKENTTDNKDIVSSETTTSENDENSQDAPTSSEAEAETPTSAQTADTDETSYHITTTSINQDNINIEYPQIEGFTDAAQESTINTMLKDDIWNSQVEDVYKEYEEDSSEINLSLDIEYQVTCHTDDILSIIYEGSGYIEGGMHPNSIFHSITIDLKNQKRLYLSDFTDINTDLVQQIKQSENVTNVAVKSYEDEGQANEVRKVLMSDIQDQDSSSMIWSLENGSENNFYVTDDSLGICLYISHAAGDYVLVLLPDHNTVESDHTYDSNLCLNNENLLISFKIKKSGKTVSVCSAKNEDYIVYRFGTKDHIDLEYPEDKNDSWSKFTYSNYNRGGGAANSGLQYNSLSFDNQGYNYEVYQQYDAVTNETTVGIIVTELATKKVTNIIGDPSTFVGYWYDLESNEKINRITP
ncbi:MAG: PdaC/SigV domain-containing protein [Lachnotalea sp.]